MAYDGPYRIETGRRSSSNYGSSGSVIFELYRTGDGKVGEIYNFTDARLVVDALNKLTTERALEKVT